MTECDESGCSTRLSIKWREEVNFWSAYLEVCTLKHMISAVASGQGEMHRYGYLAWNGTWALVLVQVYSFKHLPPSPTPPVRNTMHISSANVLENITQSPLDHPELKRIDELFDWWTLKQLSFGESFQVFFFAN